MKSYIDLLRAIEEKDIEAYKRTLLEFGFFQEDDSQELFENHLNMVHKLYAPFIKEGKHSINNENPFDQVRGFVDSIDLKGRKSPREEFLLLDRTHLGLYTKIKQWQGSIDWLISKHRGWDVYTLDGRE